MKKQIIFSICLLVMCSLANAQTVEAELLTNLKHDNGVGTNQVTGTPIEGTIIYDDTGKAVYYRNATQWVKFLDGNNAWALDGNTGTNPATNFMGTTDNNDVVFKANNIEALRIKSTNGQQLLVNEANPFNSHPLVLRANGSDILAFQDNTGAIQWHWNLLGNGLNFVESNVADYRLFLEKGGNVGVGTGAPSEKLDINGRLRIRDTQTSAADLNILTTTNDGVVQKKPLLAAETDNQLALGANGGVYQGPTVYTGFFRIIGPGAASVGNSTTSINSQNITGLPFQPSQITFVAHANVEDLDLDAIGSRSNNLANSFGTMNGFVRTTGTTTTQQVIYIGGSGNSINNISRFASSSNCIGIRYGNQDAQDLGKITASLTTFTASGFTLSVTHTLGTAGSTNQRREIFDEDLVVLYTAYK